METHEGSGDDKKVKERSFCHKIWFFTLIYLQTKVYTIRLSRNGIGKFELVAKAQFIYTGIHFFKFIRILLEMKWEDPFKYTIAEPTCNGNFLFLKVFNSYKFI